MHTYKKEIFRLIQQTKGRFVILALIVLIGSAFFTGIGASGFLMAVNVDRYADETKLKDMTLYAAVGFDETDVENIQSLDFVKQADGERFADVKGTCQGDTRTIRIHTLPKEGDLNQFILKQGRLPQKKDEVLGEAGTLTRAGYALGSKVYLSRPDGKLGDFLKVDAVTIVGTVDSPLYLNVYKETSTMRGEQIDTFFFAPSDAFAFSYFTAIDVTIKDAARLDTFGDKYFQNMTAAKAKMEESMAKIGSHRFQEIYDKANQKLEDGRREYQRSVEQFKQEIRDAEEELDAFACRIEEGKKAICGGEEEISANEQKLAQAKIDGEREIAQARAQIASGRKELDQKQAEYDALYPQSVAGAQLLGSTADALQTPLEQLQQMEALQGQLALFSDSLLLSALPDPALISIAHVLEAQIQANNPLFVIVTVGDFKNAVTMIYTGTQTALLTQLSPHADEFAALHITVPTTISAYTAMTVENMQTMMRTQQAFIVKQLRDGEKALTDGRKELDRSYEMTVNGATELYQRIEEGRRQLQQARAELVEKKAEIKMGERKLADGKKEFEIRKAEGEKQLADGLEDLKEAEKAVQKLSDKWTILERRQLYGMETYRNSVLQMKSIASVFPAFFVLVAALVCTTTMTRMIDEQRGQMGVLRTLGFSRIECSALYVFYALAAGLAGTLAGSIVGMLILPRIIYHAWGMMYALPPFHLQIPWGHCLFSIVIFSGTLLAATLSVSRRELQDVPASLLRPKALLNLHSLFMEKWRLWRHVRFIHKVTIRNLFRYKKRFILTVLGVAGCTALLVTGFGIRRSIAAMVDLQYRDISHYDALVYPKHTSDFKPLTSALRALSSSAQCENISAFAGSLKNASFTMDIDVMVFSSREEQARALTMRTRQHHEVLEMKDEGIYISEKTAENLHVQVGDEVQLQNADGESQKVRIAGVYESYLEQKVIMSKQAYHTVFDSLLKENSLLVQVPAEQLPILRKMLEKEDRVKEIIFAADLADRYDRMMGSLGLIVGVIVICSMALTFVVVGNLTMINIAERTREIATLKVLGFRKEETRRFIILENSILIVLGAMCGLLPGIGLHHWIMRQVEMTTVMFYRSVYGIDLLLAFVLTLIFGALVNRLLQKQLDAVEMVESLKSVE